MRKRQSRTEPVREQVLGLQILHGVVVRVVVQVSEGLN